MFDFAADARDQGGEPGMNHKGLVTFDRKTKKDSFYLYKAWWSDENFVHICSKRFTDRTENEIEVKVYSNQKHRRPVCGRQKAGRADRRAHLQVPRPAERRGGAPGRGRGLHRHRVLPQGGRAPNPSYKLVKTKSKSANWV